MHNWQALMHQLISNATGKVADLSGKRAESTLEDWDAALYQLVHETYKQHNDDKDEQVLSILIALHQAIIGNTSLHDLAIKCVEHDLMQNTNGWG